MNEVCLRLLDPTLDAYLKIGGYGIWKKLVLGEISAEAVLEEIRTSGLAGRGGAGFLTGLKWGFMNREEPGDKYLICNSDEGEPGTCKDTIIMRKNPHQLIEGMLICAYVIGAKTCYHYIRGEYYQEFLSCEKALKEAYARGYVGQQVFGTNWCVEIHNLLGAGSYIVGEETAMMESIEGKRAMPRNKPPFPAIAGLWGRPTTINNCETLASIPVILDKGSQWFAQMGTPQSKGSRMFCISGHVNRPGVYELPHGTPFKTLLEHCGGVRYNRRIKAVIPGGTSMRVVPGEKMLDLTLDRESLSSVNSSLGSGGIIVMDEATCMVTALTHMIRFYHHESCGQCTPCREGSGWLLKMLTRIIDGQGDAGSVPLIREVAQKIEGKTICAFGEAMSWPVTSFIDHFYDEFVYFAHHKESMVSDGDGFSWEAHVDRMSGHD